VQAVGALTVGTTTDRGGYYTLINVAAGTKHRCLRRTAPTTSKPERTTLDAPGDVAGVDFTGILVYAVSGRITSGGLCLSNVTVVIGARSAPERFQWQLHRLEAARQHLRSPAHAGRLRLRADQCDRDGGPLHQQRELSPPRRAHDQRSRVGGQRRRVQHSHHGPAPMPAPC
jgi:hypothetical protein